MNDQQRQQRLAENVAKLKEQDEEERRRQAQARAQLQLSAQKTPVVSSSTRTSRTEPEPSEGQVAPEAPPSRPIGPTAEPQPWVPSATRRSQP